MGGDGRGGVGGDGVGAFKQFLINFILYLTIKSLYIDFYVSY